MTSIYMKRILKHYLYTQITSDKIQNLFSLKSNASKLALTISKKTLLKIQEVSLMSHLLPINISIWQHKWQVVFIELVPAYVTHEPRL